MFNKFFNSFNTDEHGNIPYPLLAKEGKVFIILSTVVFLLVYLFYGILASIPFLIAMIFIIQFFRDPYRTVNRDASIVVSPADGKIIAIENTIDPYQNIPAVKVSIFMNVFNVHANRMPADGKIINIDYFPGKFFNASLDKASLDNERNAIVFSTNFGFNITMVQIAGLIARRILCYCRVGDQLKKGDRYGFIRFGSRVDLYIPSDQINNFKLLVNIGDKVYASKTHIMQKVYSS